MPEREGFTPNVEDHEPTEAGGGEAREKNSLDNLEQRRAELKERFEQRDIAFEEWRTKLVQAAENMNLHPDAVKAIENALQWLGEPSGEWSFAGDIEELKDSIPPIPALLMDAVEHGRNKVVAIIGEYRTAVDQLRNESVNTHIGELDKI